MNSPLPVNQVDEKKGLRPPAGGRRRIKGESRERLLDAASTLMVQKGTVDISLAEIAQCADLNTQLVRYYFGNKEGLLLALLKRVAVKALSDLQSLVESSVSPARKIEMHIGGIIGIYFRYPYTIRLLHALAQGDSTESSVEVSRFFVAPLAAAQKRLLQECSDAGLIRQVDPMFFYFSVVGACDFLFASHYALRDVFGRDSIDDNLRRGYAAHVVSLVMDGLRIRSSTVGIEE